MIFGNFSDVNLAGLNPDHEIWSRCLAWLANWKSGQSPRIDYLEGDAFFANLHQYDTKPLDECKWEAHKVTVDFQVVLEGGEFVGIAPDHALEQMGDYDLSKERWIYTPQESLSRIQLRSGCFAVFFPGEPHQPQISDTIHSEVVKVVFKINKRLLVDFSSV